MPANRWGFVRFSGFQLKVLQEAKSGLKVAPLSPRAESAAGDFLQSDITLTVFMAFAVLFLKERMAWNHLVAFGFLLGAVIFAFAFKSGPAAG